MFTFWAKLLGMGLLRLIDHGVVIDRNMLFFRVIDKGFSLLDQNLPAATSDL
jgi:hypothetical protein